MDITPFVIRYWYYDQWSFAEIRPCCKEESVVDYAVWIQGKLEFTVTKINDNPEDARWIVALKNADNLVDDELVRIIGEEIDKKFATVQ